MIAASAPEILRVAAAADKAATVHVVRDSDGTPVAGARVLVLGLPRAAEATTGTDGNAACDLTPSRISEVFAWAEGYARADVRSGAEVRLVPDVPIAGRLTDAADGHPPRLYFTAPGQLAFLRPISIRSMLLSTVF